MDEVSLTSSIVHTTHHHHRRLQAAATCSSPKREKGGQGDIVPYIHMKEDVGRTFSQPWDLAPPTPGASHVDPRPSTLDPVSVCGHGGGLLRTTTIGTRAWAWDDLLRA
jgi:hypothetical protein